MSRTIAWFSCGATSAVACKLALQKYEDVSIMYIETGSHDPDNKRFLRECEEWFNTSITVLQSKYKSHFDVISRIKFINSPRGASCTPRLKTYVRQEFELKHPEIKNYVWGFEKGAKEENRASRIQDRYPEYHHLFPLIENNLNKADCLSILQTAGIEIPMMYKLGYHNNNCIGCVKGGMGYWNRIRQDFPETFNKMAKIEREIGHSCLKKYFLDELPIDAGRNDKEIMPECSIFCELVNKDFNNG